MNGISYLGGGMVENIDLYYDHYKDTFEQIKSHIDKRDSYFVIAFLLLASSMFITFNPSYAQSISNAIAKKELGIDLNLAFCVLNSILVFVSFWYLIRYYQSTLCVENLYTYIHRVEDKLNSMANDYQITREGKSYLASYPVVKYFIHYFYNGAFPAIVIVGSFIKGYWELIRCRDVIPAFLLTFDLTCLSSIILFTLLFLSWVNFRDFKKITS
jgi:hypothetical protein